MIINSPKFVIPTKKTLNWKIELLPISEVVYLFDLSGWTWRNDFKISRETDTRKKTYLITLEGGYYTVLWAWAIVTKVSNKGEMKSCPIEKTKIGDTIVLYKEGNSNIETRKIINIENPIVDHYAWLHYNIKSDNKWAFLIYDNLIINWK